MRVRFVKLGIDKIFNGFNILTDTQELLSSSSVPINEIMSSRKRISLKNLKTNFDLNKSISSLKQTKVKSFSDINRDNNFYKISRKFESNTLILKENINNLTYIKQKKNKNEDSKIINKKQKNNLEESLQNKNDKIHFFMIYLFNLISCGKFHNNIKIYEDFRIKIISVENLLKIYSNVNNLMKATDKKNNIF